MTEPEQKATWEFSSQKGGSRRLDDGVWFEATLFYTQEMHKLGMPDWVWLVHWPSPALPPVWIDPGKKNLPTAGDVEAYIDAEWPPPSFFGVGA